MKHSHNKFFIPDLRASKLSDIKEERTFAKQRFMTDEGAPKFIDTEEDRVFARQLDAQSTEQTNLAVAELESVFGDGNATSMERYSTLAEFMNQRLAIHRERQNGGDTLFNNIAAFEALQRVGADTDSHYTKRLLRFAMNQEAHNMAEGAGVSLIDIDQDLSDPDALAKYFAGVPEDGWQAGLRYTPTKTGEQLMRDLPATAPLIDYMQTEAIESPWIGDSDYYAPDPYININTLSREYFLRAHEAGEPELAIETTHLFGVKYDQLSAHAKEQLFAYGTLLTSGEVERITEVVAHIPESRRASFANAFMAAEHGSDLGEQIVQMAEKSPESPEALQLLEQITNIQENILSLTTEGFVGEVDMQLADEIRQGVSARIET